jgi:lysophospholipid acyltransferase (LPLAT)-like uncharacterized protein
VIGDQRPRLRAEGTPYIYALLHAHQISAVCVNDEEQGRLAAMVSRSADGELLVPSLRLRGVIAVRGSSRKASTDKGGQSALAELRELLERRVAILLAVDGPRGPRNRVHRGVARILQQVKDAVVLPTMVVPDRRWFPGRTWDRMQLPRPFSTVTLAMDEPIRPERTTPRKRDDRVRAGPFPNLTAASSSSGREAPCRSYRSASWRPRRRPQGR